PTTCQQNFKCIDVASLGSEKHCAILRVEHACSQKHINYAQVAANHGVGQRVFASTIDQRVQVDAAVVEQLTHSRIVAHASTCQQQCGARRIQPAQNVDVDVPLAQQRFNQRTDGQCEKFV